MNDNTEIKSLSVESIVNLNIKRREQILKPIVFTGCIGMVHSAPGIGKTWLMLWLAAAIAGQGKFLKWESVRAARVLYLDSEMSLGSIQARLEQILQFADHEVPPDTLNFVTPDLTGSVALDLTDPAVQQKMLRKMNDYEVLIIDNLVDVCPIHNGREEEAWLKIQAFAVKLRLQGKCVIIVHHSGKSGSQLGTMLKERPLNWMMRLIRPHDYKNNQGARFDIKFEKGRDMIGDELETFTAHLRSSDNGLAWEWQTREKFIRDSIIELRGELKMIPTEIAKELGVSLITVKRLIRDLCL